MLRRDCRNLTYLEFSTYYHHKHYFFDAFTNMQKLKTIKIRLHRRSHDDDVKDTRILESVTKNVESITLDGYECLIILGEQFTRVSIFYFFQLGFIYRFMHQFVHFLLQIIIYCIFFFLDIGKIQVPHSS